MMYENLDPAVRFCLEAIAPGLFQKEEQASNGHLITNKTKNLQETNKLQDYNPNTPMGGSAQQETYPSVDFVPQEDIGLSEDEKDRMVAELLSDSPSTSVEEDIDVDKAVDSEIEKVLKEIL